MRLNDRLLVPAVLLLLSLAPGCAFLFEPSGGKSTPRVTEAKLPPATKQPPATGVGPQAKAVPPSPSTVAPAPMGPQAPPVIADEDGLGRGPLGRAGVLLDRAIATDEALRKSGGAVDATQLANLRMTKQARDLIASGDSDRAADVLERAIAMDDGQGYAYLYLGYIHLAAGRRDQAEVFLARAQGLLPRDPALRVEIGRLREEADAPLVPVAGSR